MTGPARRAPARPAAARPGPQPGDSMGLRSPRVKAARHLAKRAFRERDRLFLAEGPQAVREALADEGVLTELFVTGPGRARNPELAELAARQGAPVHEVSGEVMTELAQTITPQGLLGVCRFVDRPLADLVAATPRLVVVLANVRDPGNAGTVLRTADAAGADGVVFAAASVDPYNSKCVRASAGSLFHLPVIAGPDLPAALAALRTAGLQVLAADGSAAWGLPDSLLALADGVVGVPIYGRAESLNLAAAAAVCLYASAQQLRAASA
jgi:TrmH family RNA methyltransferase